MIYMYNTIFPLVWVCEWMNKLSCIYYCLNILSQKKYRLDPVLFIWENPGPDWEGVRQIGAHVCINLENKEKNYWWNWSLFTLAPIMRPTSYNWAHPNFLTQMYFNRSNGSFSLMNRNAFWRNCGWPVNSCRPNRMQWYDSIYLYIYICIFCTNIL